MTERKRRTLAMEAVTSEALLSLRTATSEAASSGADWLAIVKLQHGLIRNALDETIAQAAEPGPQFTTVLRELGYLLTAHSFAEENILYPQLGTIGVTIGSAELYFEQDAVRF